MVSPPLDSPPNSALLATIPAAIHLKRRFFSEAPNLLSTLLPGEAASEGVLKVVDVSAVRAGRLLEVVMSSDQSRAMGYLRQYD